MRLLILERGQSDAPLGSLTDIGAADVVLRPEAGGFRVVKNRYGKEGWHAESIDDVCPPRPLPTITPTEIKSGSRTLSVNDAGHGEAIIDLVDHCGSGLATRLKPHQVMALRASLGEEQS